MIEKLRSGQRGKRRWVEVWRIKIGIGFRFGIFDIKKVNCVKLYVLFLITIKSSKFPKNGGWTCPPPLTYAGYALGYLSEFGITCVVMHVIPMSTFGDIIHDISAKWETSFIDYGSQLAGIVSIHLGTSLGFVHILTYGQLAPMIYLCNIFDYHLIKTNLVIVVPPHHSHYFSGTNNTLLAQGHLPKNCVEDWQKISIGELLWGWWYVEVPQVYDSIATFHPQCSWMKWGSLVTWLSFESDVEVKTKNTPTLLSEQRIRGVDALKRCGNDSIFQFVSGASNCVLLTWRPWYYGTTHVDEVSHLTSLVHGLESPMNIIVIVNWEVRYEQSKWGCVMLGKNMYRKKELIKNKSMLVCCVFIHYNVVVNVLLVCVYVLLL